MFELYHHGLTPVFGWVAELWLYSAVFSTSETPAIKPSSFLYRSLPV
jgi:hypothetical protein